MVEALLLPRSDRRPRGGRRHHSARDTRRWKIEKGLARCASRRRASPAPATSRSTTSTRKTNPVLPISWEPDQPLHPERAVDGDPVHRARRSDIVEHRFAAPRPRRLRITNLNKLLITANTRIEAVDTAQAVAESTSRVLSEARNQARPVADGPDSARTHAALIADLRVTNQSSARSSTTRLDQAPARRCGCGGSCAQKLLEDPNLREVAIASSKARSSRLDRVTGGTEIRPQEDAR